MVWTGSGIVALIFSGFITLWLCGMDMNGGPDDLSITFFLVFAPVSLVIGGAFWWLSGYLHFCWQDEENRSFGYKLNQILTAFKCDFSVPPTIFFIPFPLLSVVSLLIAFVMWTGIFG